MDRIERYAAVTTPCYVVDKPLLKKNLSILHGVMQRTGCKILLAQKAFSMFKVYPLIGSYLCGTTASGLYEAKLGREEMGGETHIFSPAYKTAEMDEIISVCDHIVFNSFAQWKKFHPQIETAKVEGKKISCGLRINPGYAEVETELYNPCGSGSRLGITKELFEGEDLSGIDGLHFHALCEQGADVLERVLSYAEKNFGTYLYDMKWFNFGGGHHITKLGYDLELLEKLIVRVQEKYGVTVYLEPGEAVALNAGFFVAEVIDIVKNGMNIAILDGSAACHMPDVLEMPYRPEVIGAGKPFEKEFLYRLGGPTCLAGDIIGDYSFDKPLLPGDHVVFCDMAIYSMVKNNTFNGIGLPSIILDTGKKLELVKEFIYQDYKQRLS